MVSFLQCYTLPQVPSDLTREAFCLIASAFRFLSVYFSRGFCVSYHTSLVSATAKLPSVLNTSKVPRSYLFSRQSLRIMAMIDLRTVKYRPRSSSTFASSITSASATENDSFPEKSPQKIGRRKAKILAFEKTCNLHPVFP